MRAPREETGGPRLGGAPFQLHLDLLHFFLSRRDDIVDALEQMLNAQRKPDRYLQDRAALSRRFEDCFFTLAGVTDSQSQLRGQLEAAHRASGFRPRELPGLHNALADPAEMMIRVFHLWQQTRWPGRAGRVRYAHTLFNLYMIRCVALLSMRLWDGSAPGAADRLRELQGVLDRLWSIRAPGQPMLVRDARWLIPLAQSPATDDLGAYFGVAEAVAETLPVGDRIAIHGASVRMAGGHLRSQLHYFSTKKAVPLDEASLVRNTRTTNALDFALLVQDLVPLLDAYEDACNSGSDRTRLELADAICQGLSPDPELFVNRTELLCAYSMIEHLFVATDRDGRAVYTPAGVRHARLLRQYEARIGRMAEPLFEDCRRFRPVAGAYSPYGVLYGFSSDLLEHMVLKASQPEAETRFGLEDVFTGGPADSGKLAWVTGWRKLPHVAPEVQRLFEYPQAFAEAVFDRVDRALQRRVSGGERDARARTGRLFVVLGNPPEADAEASAVPDLPIRYVGSSDLELVAAHKAEALDEPQLLSDRREGRCLLSYRTPSGWVAISKSVLTDVLGAGRDARIAGLPPAAAEALMLVCPGLAVLPDDASRTAGDARRHRPQQGHAPASHGPNAD